MRQYRDILKNRDFALLWTAATVSSFGDWFLQAALYLYLYRLTGSAVHVGVLATLRSLARTAVGPAAGVAADRMDRRSMLVLSDLARFALYSALALVSSLEAVYAISLAACLFDGLHGPPASAIIPSLVPRRDVVAANALLGSTRNLQMFIAPALAGLFIAAFGPEAAFGINGVTFLGSAVLVWFIRPAGTGRAPGLPASWMAGFGDGLRYIRDNPFLVNLLAAALIAGAGTAIVDPMEVVFVERVLGAPDYGYGLVLSAAGAGALLGTLAVVPVSRVVRPDNLFGFSLALTGASLLLYPFIRGLEVMLGLVFVQGICIALFQVTRQTMIQQRCQGAQLGRVFGFIGTLGSLTYLVSKAASGLLAEMMGVANLFAAAGAFVAGGGLLYLLRSRSIPGRASGPVRE